MSDFEMARKAILRKGCAFAEIAGVSELWSALGRKQPMAGRNRWPKPNNQGVRRGAGNSPWN